MSEIADKLIDWYGVNGRDLPWRRTRDPYRIWLSEVILQQTRIAQGMDYYLRFTERFPDVGSLAAAPEDEVLKLWQGLGYYSRACNLHAAARQVAERFGGVFPRSYDEVRSLRGVGDYTAAAVCSAAYDAPCAVLDGNVFRVLARLFDIYLPIDSTAGKRTFAELAQTQLDMRCPGRYNQAVMDFGALQCTPAQPTVRLRRAVWLWPQERLRSVPSSRRKPRCATVGSTTCTSHAATGPCCGDAGEATSGRGCTSFR